MKKSLLSFTLVGILTITSLGNVTFASDDYDKAIKVSINGIEQTFDQMPIIKNSSTLVPMRGVFEALQASVEWDSRNQKVFATKDNKKIELNINSKKAKVNGESVGLSQEAIMVNNRTMVPLRFISESLGANVDWDNQSKLVSVHTSQNEETSNSEDLNNQEAINSDKVNDKQINGNILSYDEALGKALKYSFSLENAEKDVSRVEVIKDDISEQVKYIPLGTGNGEIDAMARTAYKGLQTADMNLEMAKKQVEVEKDKIAYQVLEKYNDVLLNQKKYQLAKLSYDYAKSQMAIVEKQYEVGLVSNLIKSQVQNSVTETKNQLMAAEKSLLDAREKLNNLMHETSNIDYVLEDTIHYTTLEGNLEEHVNDILRNNPTLWLLNKQVDLAQLGVDLYTYNTTQETEPYKAKKITVGKTKNTLEDVKQKTEQGVRSTYTMIKSLEDQYNGLNAKLDSAKEALKVINTKNEVGLAVDLDVNKAELDVKILEEKLDEILINLKKLHLVYNKPWAAQ